MKNKRPPWWQLYAIVIVMLGLLLLLHAAKLTGGVEEVGDGLTILVTFGGMIFWVQSNETALIRSDAEREGWGSELKITEYPPIAELRMNRELSHGAVGFEAVKRAIRSTPSGEGEKEEESEKWSAS